MCVFVTRHKAGALSAHLENLYPQGGLFRRAALRKRESEQRNSRCYHYYYRGDVYVYYDAEFPILYRNKRQSGNNDGGCDRNEVIKNKKDSAEYLSGYVRFKAHADRAGKYKRAERKIQHRQNP